MNLRAHISPPGAEIQHFQGPAEGMRERTVIVNSSPRLLGPDGAAVLQPAGDQEWDSQGHDFSYVAPRPYSSRAYAPRCRRLITIESKRSIGASRVLCGVENADSKHFSPMGLTQHD